MRGLRLRPDLQGAVAAVVEVGQGGGEVRQLGFQDSDRGGGAAEQIGPEEEEEVGEAADGGAQVRLRCAVPGLVQGRALRAVQAAGQRQLADAEARGRDEDVGARHGAVRADDLVPAYGGHGGGVQADMRLGQRGVEGAGGEEALAAQPVVRRERPAQDPVPDREPQVRTGTGLDEAGDPRVAEGESEALLQRVLPGAQGTAGTGQPVQAPVERRRHRQVGLGQHPRGGPLEEVHGRRPGRDGRHDLDGGGAAPTTVTRRPVRSTPWSHWAVCITGPVKSSSPGTSRRRGTCHGPVARTSTSAL